MPVDKFGRNGDRTTTVYTGINITNLTNSFLRKTLFTSSVGDRVRVFLSRFQLMMLHVRMAKVLQFIVIFI